MNDLEMKTLIGNSKINKISKDYYIKYDADRSPNIILLNSSLERIGFCEPFKNCLQILLVLNEEKIIVVSYKLITILKVENKEFKKIQEIEDEDIISANTIIELKNNKIVILVDTMLIILIKENEEYIIEHKIKVEMLRSQIEYITDNKILLLEKKHLFSLYILDFSEDNFKKQKLNVNLDFNLDALSQYKCLFKFKNDIIVFVIDKNLHFFNLKNEEVISIYEMEGRMTDLINFKDDSYLCCFPSLNEILLVTFDNNEYIIKDSRNYDSKFYVRGKINLINNKLFII